MEIETRGRLRNTRRVRACVRWFVRFECGYHRVARTIAALRLMVAVAARVHRLSRLFSTR